MEQGNSRARQQGRGVVATIALAAVLGGGLIGGLYWWSMQSASTEAVPAPAPAAADTAAPDVPPAQAAQRAEAALQDQRMFAPPRDNAFELYLQVAAADSGNTPARNALNDLFPYALLYIEERLAAGDLADAERMYGLMQRADANAPALPRLASSLDTLRADIAQREADAAAVAAAPPRGPQAGSASPAADPVAPATQPAATPAVAATTPTAPPRAEAPAQQQTTPSPAAATSTAPTPVAAAPSPASAPITVNEDSLPAVLSSAQPRYPVRATRRKLEGRVEVAFTVQPDGSVSSVRVLQSEPEGVFDREAVAAMERWRFAPKQTASQGRRVFDFRLN